MLNKKGLAFVDWIISMGLFIVTVLMIFTFLRPGIVPAFESEDLMNTVESNFLREYTWEAINIPIAIKNIDDSSYSIEITHKPTSEWSFIGYSSQQDLNSLDIQVSNTSSSISITCISGNNCKTEQSGANPSAGIYIQSIEKPVTTPNRVFDLEDKCSVVEIPPRCEYTLGSKETIIGLNESGILTLFNHLVTYGDKKSGWNFPDSKDFSIYLDYLNGTKIKVLSPEFEPSDQSNVFVKEISIPILEENGNRRPAKINIRIW